MGSKSEVIKKIHAQLAAAGNGEKVDVSRVAPASGEYEVTVTLSTSCLSGVIDLGTYADDDVEYAMTDLREEAIEGMGNCTVETYHDDELVTIDEWVGDKQTTVKLSNVPGAGGLALLESLESLES